MEPNIEAMVEANKNLSQRIEELKKELSELYWFRERYIDAEKQIDGLKQLLQIKRKVNRVVVMKDDVAYALQITKADDTEHGMIIEGRL